MEACVFVYTLPLGRIIRQHLLLQLVEKGSLGPIREHLKLHCIECLTASDLSSAIQLYLRGTVWLNAFHLMTASECCLDKEDLENTPR